MNRIKNHVTLIQLIESLRNHSSWCGETHVQKASYILQQLTSVPVDFNFILYKHGPYSFDLHDELIDMRENELIAIEIFDESYGPRITVTERGKNLVNRNKKIISWNNDSIEYIGGKLEKKGVVELERLSTALYVTKELDTENIPDRINEINKLKPHINPEQAEKAINEIDHLIQESKTHLKDC